MDRVVYNVIILPIILTHKFRAASPLIVHSQVPPFLMYHANNLFSLLQHTPLSLHKFLKKATTASRRKHWNRPASAYCKSIFCRIRKQNISMKRLFSSYIAPRKLRHGKSLALIVREFETLYDHRVCLNILVRRLAKNDSAICLAICSSAAPRNLSISYKILLFCCTCSVIIWFRI